MRRPLITTLLLPEYSVYQGRFYNPHLKHDYNSKGKVASELPQVVERPSGAGSLPGVRRGGVLGFRA